MKQMEDGEEPGKVIGLRAKVGGVYPPSSARKPFT